MSQESTATAFVAESAIYARLDSENGWMLYQRSSEQDPELERERAHVAIDMIGSSPLRERFKWSIGHVPSRVRPGLYHVFLVELRNEPSQPSRYVITLTSEAYERAGFDPYVLHASGAFRFGDGFPTPVPVGRCDLARWVLQDGAPPSFATSRRVQELIGAGVAQRGSVLTARWPTAEHNQEFEEIVRSLGAASRARLVLASFSFGRIESAQRYGPALVCLCDRSGEERGQVLATPAPDEAPARIQGESTHVGPTVTEGHRRPPVSPELEPFPTPRTRPQSSHAWSVDRASPGATANLAQIESLLAELRNQVARLESRLDGQSAPGGGTGSRSSPFQDAATRQGFWIGAVLSAVLIITIALCLVFVGWSWHGGGR